jgi:hypothetical protein
VFSGVIAYHLEGDYFKTILFDITEVAPKEVYAAYREVFIRRKKYGWLPVSYNTEDDLLIWLSERNIKGFLFASSYGMDGFIFAEQMNLIAAENTP